MPAPEKAMTTQPLRGERWLNNSARWWVGIALLGQWVFAWYIFNTYAIAPAQGAPARWDDLPLIYAAAFIVHVGLALGIFVGGSLQLLPIIRARAPGFHRWNGRIYLFCIAIASISGLYMIWFHSDVGGLGVQIGTSVSALLAFYFGWHTIRYARMGNFSAHRRYALRLFITASAVWFFRLQLMLWLMLSGGKGINPETFHGPALVVVSFTQYIIPLLLLEFYFAASASQKNWRKIVLAIVLTLMSLLTALGVYAASIGMWFP